MPELRAKDIFDQADKLMVAVSEISVLLGHTYGSGLTDLPHYDSKQIHDAQRVLIGHLALLRARAALKLVLDTHTVLDESTLSIIARVI